MFIKCPNCGHVFKAPVRRMGMGTAVNPNSPLSPRERQIYDIMKELQTATVRGLQRVAYQKYQLNLNYHIAQAALSRLVGRGLLKMERRGRLFVYVLP